MENLSPTSKIDSSDDKSNETKPQINSKPVKPESNNEAIKIKSN